MHRLFFALRPPPPLRAACLAAMDEGPAGWAWQDEEQLHVTLRFIGEVERARAEDIAGALAGLHAPSVMLGIDGVGWFDHGRRSALFARAVPREPLAALHAKLDRLLVRLGLEPERRSFLPHITLARARRGAEPPAAWLEARAGWQVPPQPASHVVLYESRLGRDGASYEAVTRVALA